MIESIDADLTDNILINKKMEYWIIESDIDPIGAQPQTPDLNDPDKQGLAHITSCDNNSKTDKQTFTPTNSQTKPIKED